MLTLTNKLACRQRNRKTDLAICAELVELTNNHATYFLQPKPRLRKMRAKQALPTSPFAKRSLASFEQQTTLQLRQRRNPKRRNGFWPVRKRRPEVPWEKAKPQKQSNKRKLRLVGRTRWRRRRYESDF